MPSFDGDATTPTGEATMTSLFQDKAATMPSFDGDATTPTGEATTTRSFQDAAATMPSSEDGSTTSILFDRDARITTTSTIKGYKRHNPRAGKTKRVRGGLGSK
jgi:hypothetical protein